jgi:uncharacterized protein
MKLRKILEAYPGAVVAFSGGVDSSLLLAVAQEILMERVIAVTAVSPIHPAAETLAAKNFARSLGCEHRIIRTHELDDGRFTRNTPARCYHCKRGLFSKIKKIALRRGYAVIEGSNTTDLQDYRPGIKALRLLGIHSPFISAGITKQDIRRLARRYGVPCWNKPAAACLASRIPFGIAITKKNLARVERAERYLHKLKFSPVRVRDHHPIARIEVCEQDMRRLLHDRKRILRFMKKLGYLYICLDIEGYRSGSLNPRS